MRVSINSFAVDVLPTNQIFFMLRRVSFAKERKITDTNILSTLFSTVSIFVPNRRERLSRYEFVVSFYGHMKEGFREEVAASIRNDARYSMIKLKREDVLGKCVA